MSRYSTRNRFSTQDFPNRRRGTSFSPSFSPVSGGVNEGRDLLEGLRQETVSTITKPADVPPNSNDIVIKDVEYLGSYNWVEAKQPTIIVPGSPPEWKDNPLPFNVQLDSGANFIDQNGYRMGKGPVLLPLIEAVEAIIVDKDKSDFDWSSVDFVTDRNGLRKLLRWVTATASAPPRDFRIDTQLTGDKTVLLNRWERKSKEEPGDRKPSYGFNFEKATTNPAAECHRSTGHHRIVTYDFDGLKMVVRFEVDACLPSAKAGVGAAAPVQKSTGPAASSKGVEDLADMLSSISIGSTPGSGTDSSKLDIIRAGSEIPQLSIIEMTTRSELSAATFDWGDAYPQLYLSQTPHHYLAVHKRGLFYSVRKRRLGQGDMIQIEREAQKGFRKLRKVLETVQNLVKIGGLEGRITLVCTGGELKVYERSSHESCLPSNLLALFDHKF